MKTKWLIVGRIELRGMLAGEQLSASRKVPLLRTTWDEIPLTGFTRFSGFTGFFRASLPTNKRAQTKPSPLRKDRSG